jgi:hypothetical protein
MSRNQKRINATEKAWTMKNTHSLFSPSPRFYRKRIQNREKNLLRNLSGSSAFKGGAKNEISE